MVWREKYRGVINWRRFYFLAGNSNSPRLDFSEYFFKDNTSLIDRVELDNNWEIVRKLDLVKRGNPKTSICIHYSSLVGNMDFSYYIFLPNQTHHRHPKNGLWKNFWVIFFRSNYDFITLCGDACFWFTFACGKKEIFVQQ